VDLALYGRVIWRFKFLVLAGFVGAIVLATLSFAKVSFDHNQPKLTYRKAETWQSTATILISQKGFSWGSLQASQAAFSGLGALPSFYSQLIESRALRERVGLEYEGSVFASPIVDKSTGYIAALPLIQITALSSSSTGAITLARRTTNVFLAFMAQQQQAAHLRANQRVVLTVVNPPQGASVVTPRKKTLPIVIFVMVMTATLGLAFVLENLRPHMRGVASLPGEEPTSARASKSA
jgi:capsular polysaccharide biosynthesis protein